MPFLRYHLCGTGQPEADIEDYTCQFSFAMRKWHSPRSRSCSVCEANAARDSELQVLGLAALKLMGLDEECSPHTRFPVRGNLSDQVRFLIDDASGHEYIICKPRLRRSHKVGRCRETLLPADPPSPRYFGLSQSLR